MNKKLIFTSSLLLVSTPLVVTSFLLSNNVKVQKNKNLLLDSEVSFNMQKINLENIDKDEIRNLPTDLPSYFRTNSLVGGYGEIRNFYGSKESLHLAKDVFAPHGSKVYSPAKGKIIEAFWEKSKSKSNFALGSGGQISIKVKISDLNVKEDMKKWVYIKVSSKNNSSVTFYKTIRMQFYKEGKYVPMKKFEIGNYIYDPSSKKEYDTYMSSYIPKTSRYPTKEEINEWSEYMIISYMHLSKQSILRLGKTYHYETGTLERISNYGINNNSETIDLPKRGLIGFIGNSEENGGWYNHVHIEAHHINSNPSSFLKLYNLKAKLNSSGKTRRNVRGAGVTPWGNLKSNSISDYLTYKSIINVNNIYNLYNKNTKINKINL